MPGPKSSRLKQSMKVNNYKDDDGSELIDILLATVSCSDLTLDYLRITCIALANSSVDFCKE